MARSAEAHPVTLRSVIPKLSEDKEERTRLKEDLGQMGCAGLLNRPWNLRNEMMVVELLVERSNEWDQNFRAMPTGWTSEV